MNNNESKQNNNQIFSNMIWGLFASGLNYFVGFLLTPYITRKLGLEAYGFITLSFSFITYVDVVAVAINAFAARYVAIEYYNGKIEKANSYFSSVFVANLFFIFIATIPAFVAVSQLEKLIVIPEADVYNVKLLFLFVYVDYCLNILGTLYSVLIFVKNKTDITYRNKGISTIIYALTIFLIIFLLDFKVYSVAIAYVLSSFYYFIANSFCSKRVLPEIKANIYSFSFDSIKKVISSGIWNSLNNVGAILNNGLDLLVTNRMLDNLVMGQVSIGKQISTIFNSISLILVQSFQPTQLKCYSIGDTDGLVASLNKSIKLSGIIGCSIFGTYVILGKQFLSLWLGISNIDDIFALGLVALSGDIIQISNRPLFYVFTLTDKLKFNCWVTLFTGVLNFFGMVFFLKFSNLGGYVVVGSTVIAYVLTIWTISFQSRRYLQLEKNPFNFFIFKNYFVAIFFYVIGIIANDIIYLKGWVPLIICGIFVSFLLLIISSLLLLNKDERLSVVNILKFKIGKVCK